MRKGKKSWKPKYARELPHLSRTWSGTSMLVSKLFPSACSVPGAGTGWGITFSSPWESQESTLLPMLPEKGVSQAGTPPSQAFSP